MRTADKKGQGGDFVVSLSKSEYEILSLLWSKPDGLTATEINEQAEVKSWKDASIHLILIWHSWCLESYGSLFPLNRGTALSLGQL
jgi:hypothetical protein